MDAIRNAMHKCLDAAMNDAADNNRIRPNTVQGEPSVGRHIKANSFRVQIQVRDEDERDAATGRIKGRTTKVMAVLTTRVTSVAHMNV